MGSFSFGKNKSKSSSTMNQRALGGSQFEDMYGDMGTGYNDMRANANLGFGMMPGMQGQMRDVYGAGFGGMQNQLQGGAYGDTSRYGDMLYDSMNNQGPSATSRMYQDIVGGPGNTYADPLVASMREGMNQNRLMTQGQNDLSAAGMGQGGSSRHAMTNAMNDQSFNRDMTGMEAGIREGNYANDMDWKMKIAQGADYNTQLDRDRMMGMISGGNQAQQAGMNYGSQAQNLSMGYMAPWMQAMQGPWQNMQNYSSAMGDPTVLTDASSTGSSKGFNFGMAGTGSK